MKMRGLYALLVLIVTPVHSAEAYCRLTTVKDALPDSNGCIREGVPLSWDRRCFSYTLQQDGAANLSFAAVETLVRASFASWTNVTCSGGPLGFEFYETEQTTAYTVPYFNTDAGNHNAVIFVGDWTARDHDPRAFALTTVWHDKSNGRIVDGDMEINEERGSLGQCDVNNDCDVDSGCKRVDLANVITHEVGHFLGLAHSNVEDSTMFDSAPVGETCKRSLEPDDIAGLCAAYPVGSLPDRCDPAPNGGYGFSGPALADNCNCAAADPSGTALGSLILFALLALRRHRSGAAYSTDRSN